MLPITNVITVSVSQQAATLGEFKINNVVLFTDDAFLVNTDNDVYRAYKSGTPVLDDFGAATMTYLMANALFSQQPNILAGGGQLIIAPFSPASDGVINAAVINAPGSGYSVNDILTVVQGAGSIKTFNVNTPGTGYSVNDVLTVAGGTGGTFLVTAVDAGTVTAVKLLTPGTGYTVTAGATTSAPSSGRSGCKIGVLSVTAGTGAGGTYKVTSVGGSGEVLGITQLTAGTGYATETNLPVTVSPAVGNSCTISITSILNTETMIEAVARLDALVPFCGILSTVYPAGSDRKTLADSVQGYGNKILFLPSNVYSDVAGVFTTIKAASDKRTRCLLYTTSADDALLYAAAYCGRGMCVDFDGSNTAITMNMKQLTGIDPDEGITQARWNACQTAGVDIYVNYQGVPAVVSTGGNGYFDDVYNIIWLVNALSVIGFNMLASVNTKVPQTEPGMSLIKSAFRKVCEQAVRNGYVAPGAWNSADWFGNQEDMINNILERGYYIYSAPVNLQSQADREAREAPLVQIAIKLAGAIQSINVLLNINA